MHSDGSIGRAYECDKCDFRTKRKYRLMEHQQRHVPNRSRLLCHACPASFLDIQSLKRHIVAKHTGMANQIQFT